MAKTKMSRSQALAASWATKTKRAKRRSRCAGRKVMAKTCPDKAAEVFGTPELMELNVQHILTFVSPKDVLAARQTTRSMRNTVDGSSKLKKSVGLMADPHSFFSAPMWKATLQTSWYPSAYSDDVENIFGPFIIGYSNDNHIPRSECHCQYPNLFFGLPGTLPRNEAFTRIHSFARYNARLTPLQRELSPIQPAVKMMTYRDSCRDMFRTRGDFSGRKDRGNIYAKPGSEFITFGDLEDEARQFAQAHRQCTCGADYQFISFDAKVTLKDADPCMIRHRQVINGRQA